MRSTVLAIVAALVLALGTSARGAMYELEAFGSSTGLPLTADVNIVALTPNTLQVSVTNTAYNAGLGNRITYFGVQAPNSGVAAAIDTANSSDTWSILTNAKLPGGGADSFNFLFDVQGSGASAGLNLGETLTVLFTAASPIFNNVDPFDWNPTAKMGYVIAAKWQTVGANGNDSGTGGSLRVIPEPASLGLMSLGMLALLGRRRPVRHV